MLDEDNAAGDRQLGSAHFARGAQQLLAAQAGIIGKQQDHLAAPGLADRHGPVLVVGGSRRSRWVIDAQAFQTVTTDCHLKRPSVHQSCALVVLTMIRVLAYTLAMVFYFRQVRSHARTPPPSFCQMARQLGYAFLALRFDSN